MWCVLTANIVSDYSDFCDYTVCTFCVQLMQMVPEMVNCQLLSTTEVFHRLHEWLLRISTQSHSCHLNLESTRSNCFSTVNH